MATDLLAQATQGAGRPLPVWLDAGASVFGFYHPPKSAPHPLAVMFCGPFGWEEMGSYPVRRQWALALAAAGHPVLRFDLPGTGQSVGHPGDSGLVARWTEATSAAASWLRAQDESGAVAAIGIGFGALLALHASSEGAPIDDLVLWGLPTSGRALVRRMQAFASLQDPGFGNGDRDLPDGWLQTGGFVLSAETISDLSELRTDRRPGARLRRVLLLHGDVPAGESAAAETLRAGGVEVHVEDGPGYTEMHDSPHLVRMPETTIARCAAWLVQEDAATEPGPAPVHSAEREGLVEHDGTTLRERPFEISTPSGTMFGILTEPADPAARTSTLALVCLPAMAERSIGPSRLWVEIARRHAARGVPTLRIDLLAVGDSDGDPEEMRSLRTIFDGRRIAQVHEVLDALQARTSARQFALVGLCSGGYWALNASWPDERVVRLLVLNPSVSAQVRTLILRRAIGQPIRTILQPATWRRVQVRGLAAVVKSVRIQIRAASASHDALQLDDPAVDRDELDGTNTDLAPSYRALAEELARRGGRMSVGVAEIEPAYWLLKLADLIGASDAGSTPSVAVLRSIDHNLRSCTDQHAVHRLLDDLLADVEDRRADRRRAGRVG